MKSGDTAQRQLVHALRALASRVAAGEVRLGATSVVTVMCLNAPLIEVESLIRALSDPVWEDSRRTPSGQLVRAVQSGLLTMRVRVVALAGEVWKLAPGAVGPC